MTSETFEGKSNPHCLVCNSRVSVSTRNSYQIFNSSIQTCSERPLEQVISGVLGLEVDQGNVHSHIICKKCFKLFNEVDELETRLIEVKSELLTNFKRSVLKYRNNGSSFVKIEAAQQENNSSEAKNIKVKQVMQVVPEPSPSLEELEGQLAKIHQEEVTTTYTKKCQSRQQSKSPPRPPPVPPGETEDEEEFQVETLEEHLEDTIGHYEEHVDKESTTDQLGENAEIFEDDGYNMEHLEETNNGELLEEDVQKDMLMEDSQESRLRRLKSDGDDSQNNDSCEDMEEVSMLRGIGKQEVVEEELEEGDDGDQTSALLEAAALAEQVEVKLEPGERPVERLSETAYACALCPERGTPMEARALTAHLKAVHEVRIYLCDICGEDFRKRTELSAHLDKHFASEQGDFQCEVCNRIFSNLRLFRIHKRMHYPQNKLWTCETCGKRYSSRNLLEEHINTHTGARPYCCSTCGKDFASKYTCRAHEKTHQVRPRPYTCSSCPKTFLSQQNLAQHERTHTGVKEHVCHLCGKAFGSPHNLEVHSIVHTGYKPYVCGACGKAFARKAEIRDHERTHTGERPYQCEVCGARFSQRSNLQSHKRATHLDDKRYACQACGKGFKRRRLLDYHVKAAHTGERPYKCAVCEATFVYPEHFKKHCRIHTGEKPYLCEVCGKAFNSRDNRNAHRFVHSDKKPYECLVCGTGFMRKPLLYAHMQAQGHLNDTIVVNQPRLTAETDPLEQDQDHDGLEHEQKHILAVNADGQMELVDGGELVTASLEEPPDEVVTDGHDAHDPAGKLYIAELKDHVIIEEAAQDVQEFAVYGDGDDLDGVKHLIIDGQQVEFAEDVTADDGIMEVVDSEVVTGESVAGQHIQLLQIRIPARGDQQEQQAWLKILPAAAVAEHQEVVEQVVTTDH